MHLIEGMPMDQYQRDPAPKLFPDCVASLSSHLAHTLLTRSPLHAWTDHPKLNPNWQEDDDRKFDLGTAAHKVLLEAKTFPCDAAAVRIACLPFDDYRTKDAQRAREMAVATGMLPVLYAQWERISAMVIAARTFLHSSEELAWIMESGIAEGVIVWQEDGVTMRCRPDWLTGDKKLILDYKTTDASAEPGAWSRWIMGGMGFDLQAAFYLRGLRALTGKDGKFIFLVQETKPPYACSAIGLAPAELALASDKIYAASEIWKHCLETNRWPAYPPKVHWIERPPFVEAEWQAKKGYLYDTLFGGDHGV
jgi:hypothetical protein